MKVRNGSEDFLFIELCLVIFAKNVSWFQWNESKLNIAHWEMKKKKNEQYRSRKTIEKRKNRKFNENTEVGTTQQQW